jgi:pyroglutamyl-peptidase
LTLALVTAFGAFPGAPRNPTLAILDHLRKDHARRLARLGLDLDLQVLPVRFAEVEAALNQALAQARPDLVLHLGLAGRRRHLSVELSARNRLTGLRPDAGRARACHMAVEPQGPALRRASWQAARLVRALSAHGPTRLSRDAGDYVCNQTLYLTLGRFAGPAGFLHVPPPQRDLPVRAMARAVASALVQLAVQHRVSTAGMAPAKA